MNKPKAIARTIVTSLHWSKRVPLDKIKRLYEGDAAGLLDVELLDDVGHGLFARCCDIREYLCACGGDVACRNCGRAVKRRRDDRSEVLCCRCGWQITWGDYLKKSEGHQLGASNVGALVEHFIARWPKARSSTDKLLMIDWLIHQFHVKRVGMGNPFGVNVLAGGYQEVLDFLDALAYGHNAPHQDELRRVQTTWRRARNTCLVRKSDLIRVAQSLGIRGIHTMTYDALAEAIVQAAPNQFKAIDDLLNVLTKGLREKTFDRSSRSAVRAKR